MNQWNQVQLGNLFSIEKGKIGVQAAIPGDYQLVTTGEKFGTHIEYHFEGEALCIPLVSSTGHGHASLKRIHYLNGKFSAGNILAVCLNNNPKKTLGKFVFYYLTTKKDSLIVPLMKGSANVSLKLDDIYNIEILLPPIGEQCGIVTRLDAIADKVRQVEAKLDQIEADAERLLAIRFRKIIEDADWRTMAEVAPAVRRNVEIDIERRYSEIGARSFGKGLFFKPHFEGSEATWQKPVWISDGNLVISNIKAWEGAIAVADEKHDGCIASHRYITCSPLSEKINAKFICYYLLTPEGLELIGNASPGTVDRNRTLSLTALNNIKVPVPNLIKQQAFDKLQTKLAKMKVKHTETRQALKALLPSMLEQIFTTSSQET